MNNTLTPLRRLTASLPYLLDPQTGIIKFAEEHPKEAGAPDFFRFIAEAANTNAFGQYQNFAIGGGAATTRDIALAKTLGESIERYCAAIYDPLEFPFCSYELAPFRCVHPSQWALFGQKQHDYPEFMFDRFDVFSPVRWYPVTDISDQTTIHVPASMVFVPYFFYKNGEEAAIVQPISTGLSCHCSYEEAAIGGLCEVIERDDFTITWQAKLARTRIRLSSLSNANLDLVRRFEVAGYEMHMMDISNETRIPGILVVARNRNEKFLPIAVSASVSLDPEEAVRKALEELAHTERYVFQIRNELPRLNAHEDFDNVINQVAHVNYWINHKIAHNADFLFSSDEWMDFSDLPDYSTGNPKEDLAFIATRLAETGYQPLVAEITTPDIESLGITVVRALIPGYNPLHMGYHNRATGGERLWTIPQKLGYEGISRETGDYPFPHPFP
jgi:ribosomal protein S12 methylthiotransferase accessory factor